MRTQRYNMLQSGGIYAGNENQDTSNFAVGAGKAKLPYEQFPYKIDRRSRPNTQRELVKPQLPVHEPQEMEKHKAVQPAERKESSPFEEKLKADMSQQLADNYGGDLLSTLTCRIDTPKAFLGSHDITHSLRAKMVDWMIEVLASYHMTEDSFFKSVYFMDKFLQRTSRRHETSDLHLVGVTSMFLATKYEEMHGLKLNTVFDKVAHRKLPKQSILQKEGQILEAMAFSMERPTLYDLLKHLLYCIDMGLRRHLKDYLEKVVLYLAKMSMHHYELLLQFEYRSVAAGCLYVGLKTLEQVDRTFIPEDHLKPICISCDLQEEDVLHCGSKVLALAKNFARLYPSLQNLKLFNGFCLNRSE